VLVSGDLALLIAGASDEKAGGGEDPVGWLWASDENAGGGDIDCPDCC
jgi:hypothetical protein